MDLIRGKDRVRGPNWRQNKTCQANGPDGPKGINGRQLRHLIEEDRALLDAPVIDCSTHFFEKLINFFLIALVATLTYVALESSYVTQSLGAYIKGPNMFFYTKAVILFAVVFIADRFIEDYRVSHLICL